MKNKIALIILLTIIFISAIFFIKKDYKDIFFDLDNDKIKEEIKIKNHIAFVLKNKKIIWESDNNYIVDDFIVGDLNNDGNIKVAFSVWKHGNYGDDLPFWIKENDNFFGNHLFVYQLIDNNLKMTWGSSTLDRPIINFKIKNKNKNDTKLIILEGDYNTNKKYLSIWHWNEWLFYKDSEVKSNYIKFILY
ncbi:MAG: hypothetical protein QMB51_00090 [Patescibacteria group bacterium]